MRKSGYYSSAQRVLLKLKESTTVELLTAEGSGSTGGRPTAFVATEFSRPAIQTDEWSAGDFRCRIQYRRVALLERWQRSHPLHVHGLWVCQTGGRETFIPRRVSWPRRCKHPGPSFPPPLFSARKAPPTSGRG